MENIIENNYEYLALRDAMISPNMKVNLLAVVVESGVPKKSKGTGRYPTFPSSQIPISLHLFMESYHLYRGKPAKCRIFEIKPPFIDKIRLNPFVY